VENILELKAANLNRKYVFVGCGAVAKPVIYYLDQFVDFKAENVTIVDQFDMKDVPCL